MPVFRIDKEAKPKDQREHHHQTDGARLSGSTSANPLYQPAIHITQPENSDAPGEHSLKLARSASVG